MGETGLAAELRKLASYKRNRKNFDTIQEKLAEVRAHVDEVGRIPEIIAGVVGGLQELRNTLLQTDIDNPLVTIAIEDVEAMLAELPGGESDDGVELADMLAEVETAAEDYEQIVDDREFGADARDEAWGDLCNALDNLANYLDPKGVVPASG